MPLRLAILGDSPCDQCWAACCKQNGHQFAAILQDDEIRRFRAFATSAVFERAGMMVSEFVLPYVDGRCQFLGSDDRCAVYEDRPLACRVFQCIRYFNADGVGVHGLFLERNPRVRKLLEEL